jgi:hypothetical protein
MLERDYTETDAWVDIFSMQFPVTFILSGSFVYSMFVMNDSEYEGVLIWAFVFCLAWIFVAGILVVMDLILIPPVFKLIRAMAIK